MTRFFRIYHEVNGNEYTGYTYVKADRVEKRGDSGVIADGVEIFLDEIILDIEEVDHIPDYVKNLCRRDRL